MLDLFSYGASDEEESDHAESESASKEVKSTVTASKEKRPNMESLFATLPKPKNADRKRQRENDDSDEDTRKEPKKQTEEENMKEDRIPLNPFLDDAKALKAEETPQDYTVVYQTAQREVKEDSVGVEAAPVYGYASDNTYEVQGGYGGGYSQKQYEAFMRRSGMLAAASAKTAKEANLLGEDSKYYDKPMKEAIMQGNVVALNQRDVYDSSAGASSEYWEKKDKKQSIAQGFGKYAHIAPTQVQQTRHQFTYLVSQAIDSLTDMDSRREREKRMRKETRAKYGW